MQAAMYGGPIPGGLPPAQFAYIQRMMGGSFPGSFPGHGPPPQQPPPSYGEPLLTVPSLPDIRQDTCAFADWSLLTRVHPGLSLMLLPIRSLGAAPELCLPAGIY